ncbi:MAG: carbonic anhydrase [Myxococcales bacterium]|nr:carbonic anhydrase [Myxococcales bacterium]
MIKADEALDRLREGNQRFVSGRSGGGNERTYAPAEVADGQAPFAIILGCSDSRVPAEIVFDQGLGDLFVIRVAGNIVAPSQVGSVEFAAESFGTPLVVVLGHTECGAIQATLDDLRNPGVSTSRNLRSIVDRVRPAIEGVYTPDAEGDPDRLFHQAVQANVAASVAHLQNDSEILARRIGAGQLRVVGAEYALATGVVEFLDAP